MTKISGNCAVRKGVGHFERKFQRERGVVHKRILAQKTSPWAITRCCLRDPTFSRFDTIPACDTQTDTETHDDGYYPHRASSGRVIQVAQLSLTNPSD